VSGQAEPAPLLEARDLHTQFVTPGGTVRAVDGVSLAVERGQTLGIVGESGSGKSILIRSIIDILPRNAAVRRTGSIRFDGLDLMNCGERAMRGLRGRRIAMVFQDPALALNPVRTIGAQIGESLRLHLGLSARQARARAAEQLGAVGLPDPHAALRRFPHQLSGGQRQRALIAIALACDPELVLADEPTTALDVTIQAQILDLLRREQQRRRMALILVTHDIGVVRDYADTIAVMYAGRIVEHGAASNLLDGPRMPYTAALLRAVPRLDRPPHTRLEAIPGRPPDPYRSRAGCAFEPRCTRRADRCRDQSPPLSAGMEPNHRYACWYPEGS
jgi:oligopeptide/dipeptide ABC transporter ATP-binding protein